ncbi:MAG: hypothetical protein ABSE76_02720 [Minisyncoccia bacterium]
MQLQSASFRKIAAADEFTRAACDRIPPPQIIACRALYQDLSDVATQVAVALDEWQDAYVVNDKPKTWDSKRRYAQLFLKFRELTKASWDTNYFPSDVWSVARSGPVSSFLVGYTGELTNALAVRNNFCSTLLGDAYTTCKKDWDEYADAIRDLLAVSEQVNQARQNNDRDAYLSAFVKEAELRVKVVDIEAVIKPKYLGQ